MEERFYIDKRFLIVVIVVILAIIFLMLPFLNKPSLNGEEFSYNITINEHKKSKNIHKEDCRTLGCKEGEICKEIDGKYTCVSEKKEKNQNIPNESENGEEGICGNGVCEKEIGENCKTCFKDCPCYAPYYCSKEGTCVKPVCGDGVCEVTESYLNCCTDCGCGYLATQGYVCNPKTNKCEKK